MQTSWPWRLRQIGALLILFPFIASGPPPENEVGDFISQDGMD